MKCSHLMIAMLICARLSLEAGAAESSEDGRSAAAVANGDQAPARTGMTMRRRKPAAVASPRSAVVQPHGVQQTGNGNAARLRSLLNTQTHGHVALRPRRPVGSTGAAPGNFADHGIFGVRSAAQPVPAVSPRAATQPTLRTVTPRDSILGGPRIPGLGRVDNRAFSRAPHAAAIDGAQLHRKL